MSESHLQTVGPEEALLRSVVDSIPAMLAYWDAGLQCRFANRAYERWFGISAKALIGKHISELLGPLYPLNLPYIEATLRGQPQQFEREIPDPGGAPPGTASPTTSPTSCADSSSTWPISRSASAPDQRPRRGPPRDVVARGPAVCDGGRGELTE